MISETGYIDRIATGRAVRVRRLRADGDTHRLDIAHLRELGFPHAPEDTYWRSTWLGDSEARLYPASGSHGIAVHVVHPRQPGPPLAWDSDKLMDYRIYLTATRPHFGGVRLWWTCRRCGERARILHRPLRLDEATFQCARCWGVSYVSRQLSRDSTYERFLRPLTVQQTLARALDPRCGPRRVARALRRSERILGPVVPDWASPRL